MGLLTCECANVKVYTASNDQTLTEFRLPSSLSALQTDPFFQHVSIHRFGLGGVKIEQPHLASNRTVADWIILRCENCLMDVYGAQLRSAPHQTLALGDGQMLVTMALACGEQEIGRLRQRPEYSPVFNLCLNYNTTSDTLPQDVLLGPRWSLDMLTDLHKKVNMCMQDEERATEDRIRAYIVQQKEQLRTFCARAEKDKNVLFNAVSASLKKQGVVPVSEPEAAALGHEEEPPIDYDYAPIIPGSLSASVIRDTQFRILNRPRPDLREAPYAADTTRIVPPTVEERPEHEHDEHHETRTPIRRVTFDAPAVMKSKDVVEVTPAANVHAAVFELDETRLQDGVPWGSPERDLLEDLTEEESIQEEGFEEQRGGGGSISGPSADLLGTSLPMSIPRKGQNKTYMITDQALDGSPSARPVRYDIPTNTENQDIAQSMYALIANNNSLYDNTSVPDGRRKFSVV